MPIEGQGKAGIPSFKVGRFQKDRNDRTKTTTIFGSKKPKLKPKLLSRNSAAPVSKEIFKARARTDQPLAHQEVPDSNAPKTLPSRSKKASSQPRLDGPLSAPVQELVSKITGQLNELASRTADYTDRSARLTEGKQSGIGKRHTALTQQRLALQAKVQDALAKTEAGAGDEMDHRDVKALRKTLIGLAIDLALPELAAARKKPNGDKIAAEHGKLADVLADMRQKLKASPKTGAHATGAFLKALANSSQIRSREFSSLEKAGMIRALAHGLSHGDIAVGSSPLLVPTDKEAKSLLSALREAQYSDNAARNFALHLGSDQAETITKLRDLAGSEDSVPLKDSARNLSHDAIRDTLPDHLLEAFDRKIKSAKEAAKLRDLFEAQRERTARAVGPELADLALSSVLLKANGAYKITTEEENSLEHLAPTSPQVTQMLKTMAKSNKAGAFQVAKLTLLMERLAAKENDAFGRNMFGMGNEVSFSAKAVMELTGITEDEVLALGYDRSDLDDFEQNMERLGDTGFKSVRDVRSAMDRTYSSMQGSLGNRDVQDNLKADLAHQTKALARMVKGHIFEDALTTAHGALGQTLSRDPAQAAKQAFRGISGAIQEALFRNKVGGESGFGRELTSMQKLVHALDRQIIDLTDRIASVDDEIAEKQAFLTRRKEGGLNVDPENPAGLKSSKLILKTLAYQDQIDALNPDDPVEQVMIEAFRDVRDDMLKELKGFDATAMKRTWQGKSIFSRAKPPTIDQLSGLKETAEAIIFLRETSGRKKAELQSKLQDSQLSRLEALDIRHETAPALFNAMGRLIHAAVIDHLPTHQKPDVGQGQIQPVYDMAGKREEIVTTLRDWGMDTDAFAVEIDEAIAHPIDAKTLRAWDRTDSSQSFDELMETGFIDRAQSAKGRKAMRLMGDAALLFANKRRIDSRMREELGALLNEMPKNSKFDIKTGTEITLNSGKIPLEPTATVTLRGRLAGSILQTMQIEVGSSGEFKISGLLGAGVKAGIDLDASVKAFDSIKAAGGKVDVKLGATLSGDASFEGSNGYQIVFPKNEAGRQAAIEAVMRLTESQKPSASLFEDADSISTMQRYEGSGKFSSKLHAKAEMMWQPGGDDGDMFGGPDDPNFKSGASHKHGFGAGVAITAVAGIGGKKEIMQGLDKTQLKTETKTFLGVSAQAKAYASTFTALGLATASVIDESGLQQSADRKFDKDKDPKKVEGAWKGGASTVDHEIASARIGVSVASVSKKKLEFARTGKQGAEILQKAELKELTDGANTPTMNHVMATLTGSTLEKLKQDPEKLEQARAIFAEATRIGFNSSVFQVSYKMKPDKLELANELLRETQVLRDSGETLRAKSIELEARAIIDDRENYAPSEISLLDKTTAKMRANRGNALLARVDVISSVKTERTVLSVKL